MELRDYQEDCLTAIWNDLFSRQTALAVLSTGAGKSIIIAAILKKAIESKPDIRCLVLFNKVTLLTQLADRFATLLGKDRVGVYCGTRNEKDLHKQITVASIQSIEKQPSDFNLIIIDEVHAVNENDGRYIRFIQTQTEKNPKTKVVGFTATPFRHDGLLYGDNKLFERPSYERGLRFFIDRGYLVPPICKQPDHQIDLSKLRVLKGEYRQDDIDAQTLNVGMARDQVIDCLNRAIGRKKIVWQCASINHAELIKRILIEEGEQAVCLHSKMDQQDRHKAQFDFEIGHARHLVFVTIVSEGYDCLDEKTEILTEDGWRGIGQIDTSKKVYSVNPKNNHLELVDCLRYVEREARPEERVVTVKSQHLDIRVTENHNFVFKKTFGRKKLLTETKLENIQNAGDRPVFMQGGFVSPRPGLGIGAIKLWLLGLVWADGYTAKDGSVFIYQSKPKMVRKIKAGLAWAKIKHTHNKKTVGEKGFKANHKIMNVFRIPKSEWENHFGALKKKPHQDFLKMNQKEFLIFWKGMIDGDGSVSKNKNKAPLVTVCDLEKKDFLMHLAIANGLTVMHGTGETKNGVPIYTIRVRKKIMHQLNFKDSRGAKKEYSLPVPGERFWCVTNKNGTLISRRNGRIVVIGNCPPIDCVVLMRPTRSAGIMVQTAGRGLRTYEGKENCLILDYANVIATLGPLEDPVINKPRRGAKTLLPQSQKACPQCRTYVAPRVMKCPSCGWDWPKLEATKLSLTADESAELLKREVRVMQIKDVRLSVHTSKKGHLCYKISYVPLGIFLEPLDEYFTIDLDFSMRRFILRAIELDIAVRDNPYETVAGKVNKKPSAVEFKMENKYPKILRLIF